MSIFSQSIFSAAAISNYATEAVF